MTKFLKNLKKLDPNIIRVGDRVIIANPIMFIRCGYPLSKEAMREEINKHFGSIIDDLIYSVKSGDKLIPQKHEGLFPVAVDVDHHSVSERDKIVDALVTYRLYARKFGGDHKTLHVKEQPEFKGRQFYVTKIQFVTTGIYCPGCHSHFSYEGEYEYEPPYLMDQKTHKILSLTEVPNYPTSQLRDSRTRLITISSIVRGVDSQNQYQHSYQFRPLFFNSKSNEKIEAIHVEKMPDDRELILDPETGEWVKNPHFGLPKNNRVIKIPRAGETGQ